MYEHSINKIFTVIVLVYNNSEYLRECLDSIIEQDYSDIEIIVSDDCSKSFDVEKVRVYITSKAKHNIKNSIVYHNSENLGTVRNINNAIKKSSGRYLKIIAADDALFNSEVLSKARSALVNSPDGIILSDVVQCDQRLVPNGKKTKFNQAKINDMAALDVFRNLCKKNIIDTQGVFFRNDFFEKYGLFDERFRLLEDWPKWLEITSIGIKPVYSDFIAAKYRSDCGVGTGINTVYLRDKRLAFDIYIKSHKKELGLIDYFIAKAYFELHTSRIVRRVYRLLATK